MPNFIINYWIKSRVEYTDWVSISLTTNKWRWTILQPITDETSKYFLTGNHLSAYMWALEIKRCPQQIFVVCEWSLLKYHIFDSEWAKIQRSYSDWVSNTVNGSVSIFDAKYREQVSDSITIDKYWQIVMFFLFSLQSSWFAFFEFQRFVALNLIRYLYLWLRILYSQFFSTP